MNAPLTPSPLTPLQESQLSAFVAAVRASPHNLLSRRGLEELEDRHVAECLAFAAMLPPGIESVLDLGTGGGFPGMVIAIARPDLKVTLLDATRKKMQFLEDFATSADVQVRCLVGRAEELIATHGRQFDAVTARAVAPLERLIPWALPFLRPGGALYAIKGDRYIEELAVAGPLLRRLGESAVEVVEPVHSSDEQAAVGGSAGAPRVVIIRTPA